MKAQAQEQLALDQDRIGTCALEYMPLLREGSLGLMYTRPVIVHLFVAHQADSKAWHQGRLVDVKSLQPADWTDKKHREEFEELKRVTPKEALESKVEEFMEANLLNATNASIRTAKLMFESDRSR
jgi:hypothetical protein